MNVNLLDLVKSQLSGSVLSQAAGFLGESESGTSTAMGAALPAILGSIVNKATTNDGAKGIMDMITSQKQDSGMLDNFAGLLGNSNQTQGLLQSGSGMLSSLLGNKTAGLVSAISSFAGIKSGSVSSLLSMAAPLLMNVIGKQVSSNNLGLSGLTSLLSSQAPFIKAALPASISNVLGFGDLGASAKNVAHTVTNTVNDAKSTNWMPWIVGAAVVLGSIFFWKSCQDKAAEAMAATEAAAAKTKAAAEAAAKATADKASEMKDKVATLFKVSLPSGVTLDVPKGSLEDTWVSWLSDNTKVVDKTTWFNFDRLLFDTGKSTLQASSQAQLQNVAAIMKAYPKVKIRLGGYTDNTGNPAANLKLSADRATTVMNELVKLGVDKGRLSAEGYGDQHPIGDNKTEEGRQQNRRIAVRVTEK